MDAPGSTIVKYGVSPQSLNQTAEEPWRGTKEAIGGYNHTVWIKDLKPNTTYYFIVETGQARSVHLKPDPARHKTALRCMPVYKGAEREGRLRIVLELMIPTISGSGPLAVDPQTCRLREVIVPQLVGVWMSNVPHSRKLGLLVPL